MINQDFSEEEIKSWGLSPDVIKETFITIKKRSRTATDKQLFMRSFLIELVKHINLNTDNIYEYLNTSFLIGVLAAIPLGIHEFQSKSLLYIDLPLKLELIFISLCLIMTALFYSSGGEHIYFAF